MQTALTSLQRLQQELDGDSTAVPQSDHNDLPQRVYFLSGFDPRGSSFYYRLFVEQLKAYAARTGRRLKVGRRRGQSDPLLSSWHVEEGSTDRSQTVLEVVFLHWDDIVREHWPRNPLVIAAQGVRFALWYVVRGGLIRIARMCPSVALCGFYPLLFFGFFAVLLVLLAVWLQGVLAAALGLAAWLSNAAAALVALALIPAVWRLADQQGVIWLFRSILFTHQLGQARDSALRPRLIELADCIVQLERSAPAARVELVGHSSGSFVMVMLAAQLRRHPAFAGELAPRVSLLSLGQNLANLGVHRGAAAFHDDLRTLAAVPRLPWLDITSRDDYLCFAGVDPYRNCRVPIEPPAYPRLELIRLAQRMNLATWWSLITNQFPLHFEYLHTAAPERQGGFDYFEHLLGADS